MDMEELLTRGVDTIVGRPELEQALASKTPLRIKFGVVLAIVRSIIELHNGVVRAEANEPSGCRMVIELPNRQELVA